MIPIPASTSDVTGGADWLPPKITVIIPTRERCDVLRSALSTVTSQSYSNLEILISDNFSNDETESVVRSVGDPRVRYINTGARVGMVENWEFALDHVQDGWVTIIGDDDGLLPNSLLTVAALIGAHDVAAIRSQVCAYAWPEVSGDAFGSLSLSVKAGVELRRSRVWLSNLMRGTASYPELPMLYSGGFVRMDVMQEIRRRSGRFFSSSSPDVYSAIAIASVIPDYLFVWQPLAVDGASKHSTGASSNAFRSKNFSAPVKLFLAESSMPHHRDIPLGEDGTFPPSLQVNVYESYLLSQGLRPQESVLPRSRQLEVILAGVQWHEEKISEWGKAFAKMHALDFPKISRNAKWRRFWMSLTNLPRRVSRSLQIIRIRSGPTQLPNVAAASIYAGTLLASKPNPFAVAVATLREGWRRAKRKVLS